MNDEQENDNDDFSQHAEGFIWVGDTSQRNSIERVQHEFDVQLGHAAEDFHITGFKDFSTLQLNGYGWPRVFIVLSRDWDSKREFVQEGTINKIIFNMQEMRTSAPINSASTADFVFRFYPDGSIDDHRMLRSAQSTLFLRELNLLTSDFEQREQCALALTCQRAGFTLPLPSNSVVVWKTDDSGAIIDLGVYDAVSLRTQMRQYPQFFDKKSILDENEVERDIIDCLGVLEKIRDEHLNPRHMPDEQLLFVPPRALNRRYPHYDAHDE